MRPKTSRYDHSEGRGATHDLAPGSGDLIVMGGRCQEDWLHGVPKSPGHLGARISVNFQSSAQARGRRS
jgi:alkylated DNA repair dioxygenase AlkB